MNRRVTLTLTWVFVGATARQAAVLISIFRSRRFLNCQPSNGGHADSSAHASFIYVVIPVLREAAIIRQTAEYFNALIEGHDARLVIVTTEREATEQGQRLNFGDTMHVVRELASTGRCLHLHYPDPDGLKADQLNFAARQIASFVEGTRALDSVFLICYDADSRPPLDSLLHFQNAITQYPDVGVFHQSSRFELRHNETNADLRFVGRVLRPVAEAGALRASRFVFGFELPRLLNRSALNGAWTRRIYSHVYAHVTGHGLCVQLSLLLRLPFPTQSPLEDMHYSFILGSRYIKMYPIPSLDSAEVPDSLRIQIEQAARWFSGPGRFRYYLRDPRIDRNLHAWLLAASALGFCIEWLGCAVAPPLLIPLLLRSPRVVRALTVVYVSVYLSGVVATDMFTNPSDRQARRLARILAYPANCMLFGLGGIMGAARLLRGGSNTSKTERGGACPAHH